MDSNFRRYWNIIIREPFRRVGDTFIAMIGRVQVNSVFSYLVLMFEDTAHIDR